MLLREIMYLNLLVQNCKILSKFPFFFKNNKGSVLTAGISGYRLIIMGKIYIKFFLRNITHRRMKKFNVKTKCFRL